MMSLLPRTRPARVCFALSVLLACAAPPGIRWLKLDNGVEQWVTSDAEAARFEAFQRDFGGEDFLLLAYTGGPLFEDVSLDLQLKVLEAIERIPAVRSVRSLPSLFRDHFGAEIGEELEAEIASAPFYDGAIISQDRTMAGMMIGSDSAFTAQGRRAYVAAVREAARPFSDAGWSTFVVGPGAVNAALDMASEAESRRLLPLAVAFSTALLLVLLRSIRKVAAVVTVAALTLAITLGLMGWLGLTRNMVTVALPPVLWVLSSAYAVHLLRYYDCALDEDLPPALARDQALSWALRPSLLAAFTTAMGFLSLLSAVMAPVRELGLAAAMGVPTGFLVTFGIGGCLLRWMPARTPSKKGDGTTSLFKAFEALLNTSLRPRTVRSILVVAAIAMAVFATLAFHVRVESNPLTFLDADSAIVRDSAAVSDHFTGLYTLETVLQLPGAWLDPENWPTIERQAAVLADAAGVARVLSPLDYLKKLNQWSHGGDGAAYRLPADRASAEAILEELSEEERGALRALVSPGDDSVRLSALIRVMDGQELLDIVRASETGFAEAGVDGYHTGVVLRLVRAQFALVETQIRSLGLAVIIIFGCVAVGLRSRRDFLLSIAANVAPVVFLFGLMGLTGTPLDPATVMVAAMALGIAVDDTLHLLITWRNYSESLGNAHRALREALRVNGPAMAITTLMACTGFLTLSFSTFGPIRYFGLLSAATMAAALAADLWLLPALMESTTREGITNQ